jgi:hypothetical protein
VRLCNCGIYLDAIKEIKFRFDAIISVKTLAKLIIFVIHVLLYNRLKNGVLFSTSSASINPLGLYNYVPNDGTQDYFIGQFCSAFQSGYYIAIIAYSSNLIKKNIKFYILLFIFSFDEYRILYRLSRGEKNTQRLP